MKEITVEEIKKIQLDILQDVHAYCVKNNINYSLAYGTLIGAIRHKGYIPWDDDIDIIMPRADYERFLKTYDGKEKNLKVIAPSVRIFYYAPYANVVNTRTILIEGDMGRINGLGIKIDIFPIDSVPNEKTLRMKLFNRVHTIKYLICRKNEQIQMKFNKSFFITLFIRIVLFWFPITKILDMLAKAQTSRNPFSDQVNNIVWCAAGEKGCFPRKDLDHYIDVIFEGGLYKALEGYDSFLRAQYGDYMQLPPEEKRIPRHGFEAFWKN